jgi:putative RNA 2'-phosphotransferase
VDSPKISRVLLSKVLAHALRHEPWLYELELDAEGWVPLEDVLAALRASRPAWTGLARSHVEQMLATADKQRYELDGARIRARYGHSLPGRLLRTPAAPPPVLYHGTSPAAAERIAREGLRPMGRQYVHLSADRPMAEQVGRRKAEQPVIVEVAAREAYAAGVAFYDGNPRVWLADVVPPEFMRL